MTIMGTDVDDKGKDMIPDEDVKSKASENESKDQEPEDDDNIFSNANISENSDVDVSDGKKPISISPEDKIAFIDAIVENSRFTKEYSLFGGRIKVVLRSLTSDEVNALATWTAKKGTSDSAGMLAGRYRKYLMSAEVAMLDGVEMPPLDQPLFETVGKDGSVSQPGWVDRCSYWDGMDIGKFNAIMKCISDFDILYSTLCSKAEDSNFWNPDTP